MNVEQISISLQELGAYSAWLDARSEQQKALSLTPNELDPANRSQLKLQIDYLDAQEAQLAARTDLLYEVAASGDELLPVAYRLGLVAALEATKSEQPMRTLGRNGSFALPRMSFKIDRSEQPVQPSDDPVVRAMQIGDELTRVKKLLNTSLPVPVLMVWNHHFMPPRLDYDEVVLGSVMKPRQAFDFEAPRLVEEKGIAKVKYSVPTRLRGVRKVEVIRRDEYVQPESKYKNPVIRTLAKLAGATPSHESPDALYIGAKEVAVRSAKAIADQQDYDDTLRIRATRRNRRRRPRLA